MMNGIWAGNAGRAAMRHTTLTKALSQPSCHVCNNPLQAWTLIKWAGRYYAAAMQNLRPAAQRGHADFGWLKSRHTFSFGEYHDPKHMGFRTLRVINDDRVAPGGGFATHAHRDMEILSWVIEGELAHQDSMGNGSVIRPGELQLMSAGTGVRHSENNASKTAPVHFLQIWLTPSTTGVAPGYEQRGFAPELLAGRLQLVASADGRDASVRVHQDALLFAGNFAQGQTASYRAAPGRGVWVHVVSGEVMINGSEGKAGDAVSTSDETIEIAGSVGGQVLLFDLA